MPKSISSYETLEKFAQDSLGTNRSQSELYNFRLFECPDCGPAPFILTMQHYKSLFPEHFHGKILAQCGTCDKCQKLFLEAPHMNIEAGESRPSTPGRQEILRCVCGNNAFAVAFCCRYATGDKEAHTDAAIFVGQCPQCGKCRVFVGID